MARSIGSSERDDIISAGVARYMTKSFMAERLIFLFLPKMYPAAVMRKTGSTTFNISLVMARLPLERL